jgi:5-methylcytosine-specific restriction endonuclease McrA
MRVIKIMKKLMSEKHEHFISVDGKTYDRYKYLIKIAIFFNNNYRTCEIRRSKFKSLRDFVVVGLKYSGKNVKRRTSGYAKTFIDTHDESKCLYCEIDLNNDNATADHIIPISNGGNNTQVNLIVCCNDCNSERGNTEFKEFLKRKNKRYKDKDIKNLYI